MNSFADMLPADELLPLRLRALYENYGYRRFRVGKFESYDMYMENRSFLRSEGIITFTNAQGRLMALKPDVTLSIVKNVKAEDGAQKYYYNESVFRIEHRGEEYREITQMGIEYLGADTGYAQAEVVLLALESLSAIDGEIALDVSHMGFISGLLDAMRIEGENRELALDLLCRKDADGLRRLCGELGLSDTDADALARAARFRLPLAEAIDAASALVRGETMRGALEELRALCDVLETMGKADPVFLDFSVVNDMDYYNGLVLRGYVRAAKRAVLAGGRYDKLMLRFGKEMQAIGFAIYLSELERVLHEKSQHDVDTLVLYGDACAERVAAAVKKYAAQGSVRAEKSSPAGLRARRVVRLGEGESADA